MSRSRIVVAVIAPPRAWSQAQLGEAALGGDAGASRRREGATPDPYRVSKERRISTPFRLLGQVHDEESGFRGEARRCGGSLGTNDWSSARRGHGAAYLGLCRPSAYRSRTELPLHSNGRGRTRRRAKYGVRLQPYAVASVPPRV